jgi:hypothetical protein
MKALSFVLCLSLFAVSNPVHAADKSAKDKPPEKKEPQTKEASKPSVTVNDVTYVVAKSTLGADQKWHMVLEVMSKSGEQKVEFASGRAIAPDGKTFDIKTPMGRRTKAVSLPEGVKIQIELDLGEIPKATTTMTRLELLGDRTTGIPGLGKKKGAFSKEKDHPLVIENIPIDRPEK